MENSEPRLLKNKEGKTQPPNQQSLDDQIKKLEQKLASRKRESVTLKPRTLSIPERSQQIYRYQSEFKRIQADLMDADSSYLYAKQDYLIQKLESVVNNWSHYGVFISKTFKTLCEYIASRVESLTRGHINFGRLVHFFERKVKDMLGTTINYTKAPYQRDTPQANAAHKQLTISVVEKPNLDEIMRLTQPRYQEPKAKGAPLQPEMLKKYMASCGGLFQNYQIWREIMENTSDTIKKENTGKYSVLSNQHKSLLNFSKYIEKQHLSNSQCIGCTRFFVKDSPMVNTHLWQPEIYIRETTIELELDNKGEQQDLKEVMKRMNHQNGGVVLFGAQKTYLNIQPIGQFLPRENQENFKELVMNLASEINGLKDKVKVTFVPVTKYSAKESAALIVDPKEKEHPDYQKGKYVARVAVKPQVSYLKNFKSYQPDYFTHNPFSHECMHPDKGNPFEGQGENDQATKPANASMIVVKHKNLDRVKRNLAMKGIHVEIEMPYIDKYHSMKGIIASALMYHEESFKRILQVVTYQPNFRFENRPVYLFPLVPFMNIKNVIKGDEMGKKQLQNVIDIFNVQFPSDELIYFRIRNPIYKDYEYFIGPKSKSKKAMYFLYCATKQYMLSTALKMPEGYQNDPIKMERDRQLLELPPPSNRNPKTKQA